MKVIFLDFDGVLVNRKSLIENSGMMSKAAEECVAALNRITDATDAKIVVSSSWRIMDDVVGMREQLKLWGVTGQCIDITPFDNIYDKRGHEIQRWLDCWNQNRFDEVEYMTILDDDADMAHLVPFLVKTYLETGLTEQDADRAIEILQTKISTIHANSY